MIKWRNPDSFKNDIIEMGGVHRAMNFKGDIGHIMQESGFEDIAVEANLYMVQQWLTVSCMENPTTKPCDSTN